MTTTANFFCSQSYNAANVQVYIVKVAKCALSMSFYVVVVCHFIVFCYCFFSFFFFFFLSSDIRYWTATNLESAETVCMSCLEFMYFVGIKLPPINMRERVAVAARTGYII